MLFVPSLIVVRATENPHNHLADARGLAMGRTGRTRCGQPIDPTNFEIENVRGRCPLCIATSVLWPRQGFYEVRRKKTA